MKAERELDALVAEKVMGWIRQRASSREIFKSPDGKSAFVIWDDLKFSDKSSLSDLPHYSADIAAAWQVLEHFRSQDKTLLIESDKRGYTITNANDFMLHGWDSDQVFEINAKTAPLAICLAALKAVGVNVDEKETA